MSEVDEELRQLYEQNFPETRNVVHGNIRLCKNDVPAHDILCAGFPCQPFSKSGSQRGLTDPTHGTLFHEIVDLLTRRRPRFVILENVGNFERHDGGRTWSIVQASLTNLGYDVRGTQHIGSGGHGLVSPHHLGYPHTRERFYIVASLDQLPVDPFPPADRQRRTHLGELVTPKRELSPQDIDETTLPPHHVQCIEHWNRLLQRIPEEIALPSFPIWGDEIHARYPFEDVTPYMAPTSDLLLALRRNGAWRYRPKSEILKLLPSYARTPQVAFPRWKVNFIRQNREWFRQIQPYFPPGWVRTLRQFPSSLRKLEWNCQGEMRDLWTCVLQFRPSGLRAKRYASCPALVAMTTTQVPILGPEQRFITRIEGLRLQGFPDRHRLPETREAAFRALGNAVHVGVVKAICESAFGFGRSNAVSHSDSTKARSRCRA